MTKIDFQNNNAPRCYIEKLYPFKNDHMRTYIEEIISIPTHDKLAMNYFVLKKYMKMRS